MMDFSRDGILSARKNPRWTTAQLNLARTCVHAHARVFCHGVLLMRKNLTILGFISRIADKKRVKKVAQVGEISCLSEVGIPNYAAANEYYAAFMVENSSYTEKEYYKLDTNCTWDFYLTHDTPLRWCSKTSAWYTAIREKIRDISARKPNEAGVVCSYKLHFSGKFFLHFLETNYDGKYYYSLHYSEITDLYLSPEKKNPYKFPNRIMVRTNMDELFCVLDILIRRYNNEPLIPSEDTLLMNSLLKSLREV